MSALTIKNNSGKCSQCLRAEMLKKKGKLYQTNPLRSSCQVTIQTYFISTNCTVLPFVSRPFSQFLFNLNKMTMHLLLVVKINSMTLTDRNLYTYKKNRFPFRNNYTKSCKLSRSGQSFASEWISNYTQTHHKIHEGPSV